jgi:hypothetical protein
MLTAEERSLVREALFKVLNRQQDPRSFLAAAVFVSQGDRVLKNIDLLPSPAAYAEQTIAVCLRDGWSVNPSLLETLLRYLADSQGEGALKPLAERVHAGIDPNPSPYADLWLATDRPFFDRTALRGPLQQLVTTNARPILRVEAPDGAFGLTYSRMFIEHVAKLDPVDTMPIAASVSPGNGPTYDVTDLALDLFTRPGITDPLPSRTEDSNYPRAVIRFVLTRLMARPFRWILVLDGFGQPDIRAEVREAIEALAASVASSDYRDRVRIVLLNYPGPLPEVSAIDILEEKLVPAAAIAEPEIGAVVAAISRLRTAQGQAALPEADIPAVAQGIVAAAPPDGRQRLEAFNTALAGLRTFNGGPTP